MSEVTSEFVARFVGTLLRFSEGREHLIDQILFLPDNGMGWFEGDLIITMAQPIRLDRDFVTPLDSVTLLDASSLLVNLPYDIRGLWLDLAEEALLVADRLPPAQPTMAHALLLAKATRRIETLRRGRLPDPVHEAPTGTGDWYFYDETWMDRHGPYPTESAARRRLRVYASDLDERTQAAAPAPATRVPSEEP
jgi:hypothetical protein